MPIPTNVLVYISALLLSCMSFFASAETRVVTSIKPLQLLAAEIQYGLGEPSVLLPPGASPHSFALRPSDLVQIQEADLVYWIGPDLEAFLMKSLDARTGKSVAVQSLKGMHIRHFGDTPTETAQAAPDRDLPGDDHDDLHRVGTLDAHLWLRPANALIIARQMADDLSSVDPKNAARYETNFAAFRQRLTATDLQLKARLGMLTLKPFFVFHQAFDYFEEAYGLRHTGVLAIGTAEIQPGARHVSEMREKLAATGPSCIFVEPPLRPRLADTLADGLPVQIAELDALGFGLQPAPGGYEKLIGDLGNGLASCLERL